MMGLVAFMTACDDDDDTNKPSDMEPGMLTVSDQMVSQNMVMVESVTFEEDGWIVIHANKADDSGPVVPQIISEPVFVEAGTETDVMIPLTTDAMMDIEDTKVWVMLHTDTGVSGDYEFDTNQDLDPPLANLAGDVIITPIMLMPAMIMVDDQAVTNSVTLDVNAAADGWIVVHNMAGEGIELPGIIGKTAITKGMNENVTIMLDEGVTITPGQKLFPMVHIDASPKGEYNFPGVDAPEVFGYNNEGTANIVVTSINVK